MKLQDKLYNSDKSVEFTITARVQGAAPFVWLATANTSNENFLVADDGSVMNAPGIRLQMKPTGPAPIRDAEVGMTDFFGESVGKVRISVKRDGDGDLEWTFVVTPGLDGESQSRLYVYTNDPRVKKDDEEDDDSFGF